MTVKSSPMKPFKYIGQGRYECGGVVAHFDRFVRGSHSEALNVTNAHGVRVFILVRIAPGLTRSDVLFRLAQTLQRTAFSLVRRRSEVSDRDHQALHAFNAWVVGIAQPNGQPLGASVADYIDHLRQALTLPLEELRGITPELLAELRHLRGSTLDKISAVEQVHRDTLNSVKP